jgi:hypothetical protein
MRTKIILLPILCMAFLLTTCKEDPEPTTNDGSIVIFSSTFDNHADLALWSQSPGGEAAIVQNTLNLVAKTSCFKFETKEAIPVQPGKTYFLNFWAKVDSASIGDTHYCGADFLVQVVKDSTNVVYGNIRNYGWTQKSYSFQVASADSVSIEFLTGTTRGAWLGNLELIEQ